MDSTYEVTGAAAAGLISLHLTMLSAYSAGLGSSQEESEGDGREECELHCA